MRALVLHWGRNGGGPRFAADSVAALRSVGVWTASSWSRQSERAGAAPSAADADLPIDTFSTAAQSVLRSPNALLAGIRLRRYVIEERIDCVFAAMEQIWQPAAAVMLRSTRVPYLLGLHDARFHPGDGGRLQALTRALEIKSSDGLTTFSEAVRLEVERTGLAPTERIWSTFLPASISVSADKARPPAFGERRVVKIGFFGRWQAYKGLSMLVEAAELMRSRTKTPFEVHVHGDGDDTGLDGAGAAVIVHRGWTPEAAVERTLAQFDVLVAPYVEASQSGVVPLAAALGVPAVVTPVGGLLEQVREGETGVVASRVDADALASALLRVVDDAELRGRLAEGAMRRSSSERSLVRFGEELRGTMEELIGLGKRG